MESTYFYKCHAAQVVFFVLCVSDVGNSVTITNGPIDTISFVGYPSQMNCTLSEYINNAAWAYLSDSNRPIGISLGDVVFNDAYELITNQASGVYMYNLYVTNVKTSMNYVHLCEIFGSDPPVRDEAMLHVLTSGPMCELVPSRFVVAEEEATFNCSVENGIPPGELVWYANETEIKRENNSLSNIWHPVFWKEDNGTTVNCHLGHESILPSAVEAAKCGEDIIIVVQYPPTVNITNATRNEVFRGENFTAECKVEEVGYPPEIIELYWRGPNNEIYDTSTLILENITRELGGNYTCIASNEYADGRMGDGPASLLLDVQYAPFLDVKLHGNASEYGLAVEGETFSVECTVTDANPQPHVISWFDGKGTKVSSNEWMEFNAVQRNQSGNYTCEATNLFFDGTMGNATTGFSIFVQYIPEVKVTITGNASSTGRVIEGHSFEAECEVLDSNPPYNNITWFDSSRIVSSGGMVKFKDVRRKQSGDYTCVATNTFWDGRTGTGTAIMNINVEYPPVASINDESDGRVVEGRAYNGICSSVANPAANFSWRNQRGDEINAGPELYLSDVKREESGVYTCIATNRLWDDSKAQGNDSISLDVQYNPVIELRLYGLHESRKVIEGDDFSVLCIADSKPEVDSIAWHDSTADGVWLNFTSVERNEDGDYICIVNNTFWDNSTGTGKKHIFIDVQYSPTVKEQTVFCVEHDLDVKISCEVDSNPSPSFYQWTRNGYLLSLERTYVINRANQSDSGNYTCTATNVFYDDNNATDSGVTKITVQYPPEIVSKEIIVEVAQGDSVPMSCMAHGLPTPTITWFDHNDTPITGDEANIGITMEGSTSKELVTSNLTITVADESYYGTYTCKASNNIPPDDEQTMEIVKPGSNSEIIAISLGVSCSVIVLVLIIGIVLGVLFYNKRGTKIQNSNTDFINTSPETSAYAEITANTLNDRQEQEGLSEGIDLSRFEETPVEKLYHNSPQHVALDGRNITSNRMMTAAPQTDIIYEEVDLTSCGGPGQQSQSQAPDTEQMQYASLQHTLPSEYQSLR